jgi:hypothetical protein
VDFGTKTDIPKSWGLGGLGGCLAPCRELRRFSGAQQERGREGPLRGFPSPQFLPSSRAGDLPSSSLSVGGKRGGWCILCTYVFRTSCCAALVRFVQESYTLPRGFGELSLKPRAWPWSTTLSARWRGLRDRVCIVSAGREVRSVSRRRRRRTGYSSRLCPRRSGSCCRTRRSRSRATVAFTDHPAT